jgi:hypothetical protein
MQNWTSFAANCHAAGRRGVQIRCAGKLPPDERAIGECIPIPRAKKRDAIFSRTALSKLNRIRV